MKIFFAVFLVVHGLIHLIGTAKAFGVADIPQLTQQIARPLGILWLLAAALFLLAAILLFTWPQRWWVVGAGAVVVSQVVILTSWSDARYGTIANIVALVGVALGFLSQGPSSFRAEYDREIAQGLGRAVPTPLLTEADLAQLPTPVQRYIRLNGAVGQPRVQNFRARFHGQIRSGPSARWMSFTGEQYNFYDQPSRLFLMDASMFGVPFQVFHRFVGPSATMRVKVASVVTMVDAKGPEMDEAETVTLFNDLCVFAPGALIGRGIRWQEIDPYCPKSRPSGYGRLAEHFTPPARSNSASHRAVDADESDPRVDQVPGLDEPILEALMIPLAMVVIDEFLEGPSEMALAERHDPIEALVFDRPHKPFGVGVRIGRLKRRLHDVDTRHRPASADSRLHFRSRSQISTRWSLNRPSAAVSVRPTWRMKRSLGCGVDPTI